MKKISEQEAKQIRLDLLSELDSFCNKNNIKYFLGFGTLIGAIRHNGYIPWDDDVDILIPRPDLNKLEKIYINSERFELINNREKENDLIYGFDRLIDKRTIQKIGEFKTHGINIELYPIDACPSSVCVRFLYLFIMHFLFLIENKIYHYVIFKAIAKKWPYNKLKILPIYLFIKMYYKIGSIFKYNKSKYVCVLFGNPYKLKSMDSRWFISGNYHTFENLKLMIPCGYDEYLSQIYGNYMKLPPIEKRIPSHNNTYFWKK
ncbi:MAG: LicD family protein [Prevotella sp.]|nr:LicD family protein [Candidatus Prevotella equi]